MRVRQFVRQLEALQLLTWNHKHGLKCECSSCRALWSKLELDFPVENRVTKDSSALPDVVQICFAIAGIFLALAGVLFYMLSRN